MREGVDCCLAEDRDQSRTLENGNEPSGFVNGG
jgi:hypothetical protein